MLLHMRLRYPSLLINCCDAGGVLELYRERCFDGLF